METLTQSIGHLPEFSPERDVLSAALFGAATPLPFDPEGRILLPKALADQVGLAEEAAFVGKGDSFQIWEPKALAAFMAEARERVARDGISLPVRAPVAPVSGGAGS